MATRGLENTLFEETGTESNTGKKNNSGWKKWVVYPMVAGLLFTGVGFKKDATGKFNIGQSAVEAAQSLDVPDAIEADPDKKLADVWWDMHGDRYFDHPYSCNGREMAKRVMNLSDGYSYNGVVKEITQQTSHPYQLMAAQLGLFPYRMDERNIGLKSFRKGLKEFYHERPSYYHSALKFAEGIFANAATTAAEKANYEKKAKRFMEADLETKEEMLTESVSKFNGVEADPEVTDPFDPRYQKHSLYWNLGWYILSEYTRGNKNEAASLRNDKNKTYRTLKNEFNFHTAQGSMI